VGDCGHGYSAGHVTPSLGNEKCCRRGSIQHSSRRSSGLHASLHASLVALTYVGQQHLLARSDVPQGEDDGWGGGLGGGWAECVCVCGGGGGAGGGGVQAVCV
jgi:hypothetical protein